jgi:hypothetical protein
MLFPVQSVDFHRYLKLSFPIFQIQILVYGIVEQKVSFLSNWLQDDTDANDDDAIEHLRLWHDVDETSATSKKMLAAVAGSNLHIWSIGYGKTGPCGQCYKTFYGRKLRLFIIS